MASPNLADSRTSSVGPSAKELVQRFQQVRRFSETIAAPLSPEDCSIQSMPDASPTRWHLAHTTWFFETFVLRPRAGYQSFHPAFEYLFNSYYNAVGQQFPRERRGQISRPGLQQTMEYRYRVDQQMTWLLREGELTADEMHVVELGLQHEQQHQELMLTDIKHALFCNPLFPAYCSGAGSRQAETTVSLAPWEWHEVEEQTVDTGFAGEGFSYDNERPRHRTHLAAHRLATRCVTVGEYAAFVDAGGYQNSQFWLAEGWARVQSNNWVAPLYWVRKGAEWQQFSLAGLGSLLENEPVSHLSYFEADAYARWAGKRLPTEAEWEWTAARQEIAGHFADPLVRDNGFVHPQAEGPWNSKVFSKQTVPLVGSGSSDAGSKRMANMFGNLWEWTSSPYTAYPGYRAPEGALGEYNGKFMCNQFVLRGGSCATPLNHIRATYRNFFPAETRWQFSGIRLAE